MPEEVFDLRATINLRPFAFDAGFDMGRARGFLRWISLTIPAPAARLRFQPTDKPYRPRRGARCWLSEPDLSAGGAAITKAFAYRNVLTVLQEICEVAQEKNNVWLGFDVVRTAPGAFEFRTYTGQRGQNHGRASGDPRLVGKQYGNLSEATFGTYHADERNCVLVAGQGEEAARVLVTRTNAARMGASKWNRREYFKDSRDEETTAGLEADGDAALDEFRPRQVLTGTIHDTPGMQYNIHYQFGDVLSAEAFGYRVDCHVGSVRVKVDQDGGEQLDIKLRGEL